MSLYEILSDENVVESINNNLDYLVKCIPEIKYMMGFEHKHPHHHLDVWQHTLLALSFSENDFDIRLTLLLHDIGKPFSFQEKDGIRHFNGHPKVSAVMSYDILKRIGFGEDYIQKICYYIKNHDNPISNKLIENNYNDAIFLYKIQKCDALAHHPEKLEKRKQYLKKIGSKLQI